MKDAPVVTAEAMANHILSLCSEFGIKVYWCTKIMRSWASHKHDEICIAPIRSEISYAVALHEIGHIKGLRQNSPKVMVCERAAWKWAKSNAKAWTPRMEMKVSQTLAWIEPRAARMDAYRVKLIRAIAVQAANPEKSHSAIADEVGFSRLIPIRLINPWRCTTPPDWREYAAMMLAGDEFPPVEVIRQSSRLHGYPYRLCDGFHRTRAAKHIGRRTIRAHVIVDETQRLGSRRHESYRAPRFF